MVLALISIQMCINRLRDNHDTESYEDPDYQMETICPHPFIYKVCPEGIQTCNMKNRDIS